MGIKQPRRRALPGASGFTLIELLVSISILALLISILLPALRRAQNQARRVVCQSNMKNINTSLQAYINLLDAYPLVLRVSPDNCNDVSWATWSFGGWTGRDYETYCDPKGEGRHCYQTHQRPLSVFMNQPRPVPPDDPGRDGVFGTGDDQVMDMPIFRCPSDNLSTQWRWRNSDPSVFLRDMSAYEQTGSSYQMNYYWFYQALARAQVGGDEPCQRKRQYERAFDIGRRLWQSAAGQGGSARFVTVVEDPFDWGIAQGLRRAADASADDSYRPLTCGEQTMGFHERWSWHVTAFLDGHVDYIHADTRVQREAHWTVTNELWKDTRRKENCLE